MRKVGIITIHRINNFGSVLQAYATLKAVESLGYDAEIIDYRYPNEYHTAKRKVQRSGIRSTLTFFDKWRGRLYRRTLSRFDFRKRSTKFDCFRNTFLKCSSEYPDMDSLKSIEGKYDIYITGSDQVWNPRYMFDDYSYLLPFVESKNKIAFSASFGTESIPYKYKEIYKPFLLNYKSISVREESGVDLIKEICSNSVPCTCDPSLLLSKEDWNGLIPQKPIINGKYILCYIMTYTSNPYPYALEFVENIRHLLGCKVVCIGSPSQYWLRRGYIERNDCGPIDFLNLYKNASFVISCSFHGTAFSVIFKKDFYSILPPGIDDDRQKSLLMKIGAEDRMIRVGDPMPKLDSIHINNWDEISKRYEDFRNNSNHYLRTALSI